MQLARFGQGNHFFGGIDDEHQIRHAAHILDTAQRTFQLVLLTGELDQFFFGQASLCIFGQQTFQIAQTLDGMRNGGPVGQSTTQPAVIDVILRTAFGRRSHYFAGLALGADKQNPAAFGRHFADLDQSLVQQRDRL